MMNKKLWEQSMPHQFFQTYKVKSYKIVKQRKDNFLIGFFDKYEDLINALKTPFTLEELPFQWEKFSLPKFPQNSSLGKKQKNSNKQAKKKQPKSSSKQGPKKEQKMTKDGKANIADIVIKLLSLLV